MAASNRKQAAEKRGHRSERLAELLLCLKGHRILGRRVKTHAGEIDLIALPLIGPVKLTGLTIEEADQAMTAAYGAVLRNPQVAALVTAYGAAEIYVGGEVKAGGVKTFKGQVSVTQAIMAAGGFSDTARSGQVVVLRQGPHDPRPRLAIVDVRGALQGKDRRGILLMPGDVVFVPKTSIAEVDVFVKQHLTDQVPFSLSYGIGGTNGHL